MLTLVLVFFKLLMLTHNLREDTEFSSPNIILV